MNSAAKKTSVASSAAAQPRENLAFNRRILVVEDEPAIAEGYVSILQPSKDGSSVVPIKRTSRGGPAKPEDTKATAENFEVTVVHSAQDAIAALDKALQENRPYAMGFFDVMLGPGMDGIELVKTLHAKDPALCAVFVTAYHDRGVDAISEYLGVEMADRWDYLNKPFSEGEILQKARNAVAHWNLRFQKRVQDEKFADANRRLLSNDRMSAVAAVSRGVGHEFGNILLQIMGRAELSAKGTPEEMKKALDTILKASETASRILEKFKNLAKPSEAQTRREDIWAQAPVEEALELIDHTFKSHNIKVCKIKWDRVKLNGSHASLVQVFMNVFINALHAMGGPGQIDLTLREDGNHVEYRVRDYGPGIPAENLGRVTEAFFTTKGDKGTGLGLSICREIIEIEHRGEIQVSNHPMKGAEFVFRIPKKHEEG